jgi:integrase
VLTVVEALEETRVGGITVKVPRRTERSRRKITLPARVVEALRPHRLEQMERHIAGGRKAPASDLVFPRDGGYYPPNQFSAMWGRAVRQRGLPKVTWHALRHTHASMLIAAGVDAVTISKRLGHASADFTLRVYSHLYADDDRKASDAIDVLL